MAGGSVWQTYNNNQNIRKRTWCNRQPNSTVGKVNKDPKYVYLFKKKNCEQMRIC